MRKLLLLFTVCYFGCISCRQQVRAYLLREDFYKVETMIPMRDGTKLFTAIYIPRDTSVSYPFLIQRTPYSCAPYGENNYASHIGPNSLLEKDKYIFVYQDVRGRYRSEGSFQEMTPAIDEKKSNQDVDESSDAFDTIDWLLKNIRNNNGKAGIYGISYPGFYAAASLPDAHPALKAVSPQAPVTDEFEGDDAYHRGAFYLMDNFSFMNEFDRPRPTPWESYPPINDSIYIIDVYDFYLRGGPIKNLNAVYFHDSSKIWNEYLAHNTKDGYWQDRNIRPHLKNIKPAVLVVGGWFDAEDMFGALKTFEAIDKQSPQNNHYLIMGPWTHGAWAGSSWTNFGGYSFGTNTSSYFQQKEYRFFNYYLKGKGSFTDQKAEVFITGSNHWRQFPAWPPMNTHLSAWYFSDHQQLSTSKPTDTDSFDEYVSDPANPVPYIDKKSRERLNEYMVADQTFASKRPDVIYYTSKILDSSLTVAGNIQACLSVSTTGTDVDFIVKIIDVLPDQASTQQLVRAEVLRGKFRNSYVHPEPFIPDTITNVKLELNDVAHAFLKGHRIMVQLQSSWFPLVDRNPQQFLDISKAEAPDFKKQTIKIYHDQQHPSFIQVKTLATVAAE